MGDIDKLYLPDPFNAHTHLRGGNDTAQEQLMAWVAPFSPVQFPGGVIAMTNTNPPIVTAEDVNNYRNQLYNYAPKIDAFIPVMLVNSMTPEILEEAITVGRAFGLKWIPGGASTNAQDGVSIDDLEKFYPVLEMLIKLKRPFLAHWERTHDEKGKEIPEVERELAAIPDLTKLMEDLPNLKMVVEHASTLDMLTLVNLAPNNIAASLTIHHPVITTDDVLNKEGKIKNPHLYCKPIAKRAEDADAVLKAMRSGNKKFFLGTDSAPHYNIAKNKANPPAGIFSDAIALQLLVHIFDPKTDEDVKALKNFACYNGPEFYGIRLAEKPKVAILLKEPWTTPTTFEDLTIFMGGQEINWRML